jgi:hypothetical protein
MFVNTIWENTMQLFKTTTLRLRRRRLRAAAALRLTGSSSSSSLSSSRSSGSRHTLIPASSFGSTPLDSMTAAVIIITVRCN